MNARFVGIQAAAGLIGPGSIEVPLYQTEITDLVRRRGLFGQRIKSAPATGHPSRFFQEAGEATRREGSVPLKAIAAQINYNLFDVELGEASSHFAYLKAKDLTDTVDGVLRAHDVALWNGDDTSLSTPTTHQYFGAVGQIIAGGNTVTVGTAGSIVHGLKSAVAEMMANPAFTVRPTAIYANPVLLDLIEHEFKAEFGSPLPKMEIAGRFTVMTLSTQAGELPLIPEWDLGYTGTPGSGHAILPAYIVSEDLIEYHWLADPNPRVFQIGVPGSLALQYVVVKFGGLVVKGASYAHAQVLVETTQIGDVKFAEVPAEYPFLREIEGHIIGVGFEPGKSEVRVKGATAAIAFDSNADDVEKALAIRKEDARLLGISDGKRARLLRISKASEPRFAVTPEGIEEHIFRRWDGVFARLAK